MTAADEPTLLLTEEDVRQTIASPETAAELDQAFERALLLQARGTIDLRTRLVLDYPWGSVGERNGRSLRLLPCLAPELGGGAVRLYTTLKDDDPARSAPVELLLLFDRDTMQLRSLIEDYSLHAVRTGAPTSVATRVLARPGSEVVAVYGTGRQARGQLAAVAAAVPVRRVRVFGRDRARAEAFCAEMADLLGCRVDLARDPRDPVRGADVVVSATTSRTPVLLGEWLEPGQHVNTIAPGELDDHAALRVRAFPCSTNEVLHGIPRWTPFAELVDRGVLAAEALATELCAVVAGSALGRTSDDEITAFLSTGMAFWDLVIAAWVDGKARELGVGTPLPIRGHPSDGRVVVPSPSSSPLRARSRPA